jgi:hypothetical protein
MDNCYNDLINEELMIKNISELELDMEYYIKFVNINDKMSGLYKIKRVFNSDYCNSILCEVTNIDNNIEFSLINLIKCIISKRATKRHPLNPDKILGYFTTLNLKRSTCNIYKLPQTEYVLK